MGTHPIFESDFDCLTAIQRVIEETSRVKKKSKKYKNDVIFNEFVKYQWKLQ